MNTKPRKPLSYYKYGKHKRDAATRGIEFKLTLEEWYSWWLQQGVDKNIKQPLNKNTLCMCRYNDIGPYELGNIYCATLSQNQKDARKFNPEYGKTRSKPYKVLKTIYPSKKDAYNSLGIGIRSLEKLERMYPNDYGFI
jgi:hypothetical protein